MRIISWNVNGIRAVHKKELFVPFVNEYQPDMLYLQESRARRWRTWEWATGRKVAHRAGRDVRGQPGRRMSAMRFAPNPLSSLRKTMCNCTSGDPYPQDFV